MVGIGRPQVLRHSVCFLQHAFLSPGHGTLFLGCLLSHSTSRTAEKYIDFVGTRPKSSSSSKFVNLSVVIVEVLRLRA